MPLIIKSGKNYIRLWRKSRRIMTHNFLGCLPGDTRPIQKSILGNNGKIFLSMLWSSANNFISRLNSKNKNKNPNSTLLKKVGMFLCGCRSKEKKKETNRSLR